jgi:rubredoxin
MESDRECPDCGGAEFYRAASTLVHLGRKVKWRCAECGHGFVTIDGAVDTGTA